MPIETQVAVTWALSQTYEDFDGSNIPITKDTSQPLVDSVRNYFNTNNVTYQTFSYSDLQPYL